LTIADAILEHFPDLNDDQQKIVGHADGPLLVVAGPGSGKTYSIVLRALNLLLLGRATAKEILLCTFTEKAAFEMRDRLSAAAQKVDYCGDLSELRITTIHGLCNRILTQYRHWTDLGNGYETLDELTQLLFIFEHFDEILGPAENDLYLGKWKTRWTAIEGARSYFDKINGGIDRSCPTVRLERSMYCAVSPAPTAHTRQPSWPTKSYGLRPPAEHRAWASAEA